MTIFSATHIFFLIATVAFLALTALIVAKLPKLGQTISFYVAAALCAGGIFYRYALGLSLDKGVRLDALAIQMLQVCNFNFVLVILMLFPRCELARQYSVCFAMFAACTTFISIPTDWKHLDWQDASILNFWLNHVFAVALPLWMVAARRLKPKKEYVLKVLLCVAAYFTLSYLITLLLKAVEVLPQSASFSFIFSPGSNPLLGLLYAWVPIPYLYLLPLLPVLYLFLRLLAWAFKKYDARGEYKAISRN